MLHQSIPSGFELSILAQECACPPSFPPHRFPFIENDGDLEATLCDVFCHDVSSILFGFASVGGRSAERWAVKNVRRRFPLFYCPFFCRLLGCSIRHAGRLISTFACFSKYRTSVGLKCLFSIGHPLSNSYHPPVVTLYLVLSILTARRILCAVQSGGPKNPRNIRKPTHCSKPNLP